MAFNWLEYLYLAKNLVGIESESPNQEARRRSAISRAYYAAYCLGRNYVIIVEGAIPKNVNPHKYVRKYFLDNKLTEIGESLGRLCFSRDDADYEDEIKKDLESKANEAIYWAEIIIKNLENLYKKVEKSKLH